MGAIYKRHHMTGVYEDNLNTLITKSKVNFQSIVDDSSEYITILSELSDSYDGSSLEYLFLEFLNEINNVDDTNKVVKSYIDLLENVKISYQKQDLNMVAHINNIISKIGR